MQLFRWVHFLYVPFLLLLLFHAKNGFSWKAALFVLVPMALWLMDKLFFVWRRVRTPFPVVSVAHIRPNALRLELSTRLAGEEWTRHSSEGGFECGAFAYVNFPALSSAIWLPVTLSSAPPALPSASTAGSSHDHGWSQDGGDGREMVGMMPGSTYLAAAVAASAGSSSPSTLTLHFPIESGRLHSFSAKVQEYFEALGPLGSAHYFLDERRRTGADATMAGGPSSPSGSSSGGAAAAGRLFDNQGQRLIRLDGPHRSPVSHVVRYHSAMVVAPTSGVNALASVLKTVVLQRWKQHLVGVGMGLQQGHHGSSASSSFSSSSSSARGLQVGGAAARGFFSTPDCLFLVWSLPWSDVDDARWFCQTIKDCEDELYLMRESPDSEHMLRHKHLEIHIFVSNVPSDAAALAAAQTAQRTDEEEGFFGPALNLHGGSIAARSPFTTLQLYRALKNPTGGAPQQFSDVHVHRGAPNFGDLLSALAHRATGQTDVGCIYTAGPLAAHINPAAATYLHSAGMPAPSRAQIASYERTAKQLKEQCAHQTRQSGKTWRFHSEVDT
jgi:hypothetical protein